VCHKVIAAIILAAGASKRLGKPKQLVELAGETLLERAVRTARDAGCAPIVLVLGAGHLEILAHNQFHDAVPIINDQWSEGMATSIRLAVRTLGFIAKSANGVILMTCDQPAVTADHLQSLIAIGGVAASSYAGRLGVPAYFPAGHFPELIKLTGDAGARELLQGMPSVELAHGELDVDTAEDVNQAKRLFE
jgi:molybdenum cofactor cytidylyltransferase